MRVTPDGVEVTAHGSRQALEGLYVELRELARKRGLTIEYELSTTPPPEKVAPAE